MPIPTVSSVANPQTKGFGARLNDLLLRLAVGPNDAVQVLQTAEDEAQRLDTSFNPEDYIPDAGKVYSMVDLSGGENLAFAHRRNASETDPLRFWRSENLDVTRGGPDQTTSFRVAKELDANNLGLSLGTNPYMVLSPLDTNDVFLANNSSVILVENAASSSPTPTTEDPSAGTQNVTGLAVIGDIVYAAAGSDGIEQRSSGGVWSSLNATDTVGRIWAVKGRLLGVVGTALSEFDLSTGAKTDIIIGPSGTSFVDVCEAGPVILAASTDGTVYALTINDTADLVIASQTAMPKGEQPTMVAYNAGTALVGTRTAVLSGYIGRLYQAGISTADSAYSLTDLQLIRTWGDSTATEDLAPRNAWNTRDSILFTSFDAEGGGTCRVWRFMLGTSGLANESTFASGVPHFDMVVSGGKVVTSAASVNVMRYETDLYAASSWLISPAIDFFTASNKVWESVTLSADIPDGQVRLYASSNLDALNDRNHASWQHIQTYLDSGSTGTSISLNLTSSRYLILKVEIASSSTQLTAPTLRSVALRSFPVTRDVLVRVPINFSDSIERPNRKPIHIQGWGRRVQQEVYALRGRSIELELYREQLLVTGKLERIQAVQRGRGRRGYPGERGYIEVRGRIVYIGGITETITVEGTRGIDTRSLLTRGT